MDQGLQQGAGVVRDGAGEEQIVQHEEIAVDDGSQPDLALRRGVQDVAVEEVVGLKILDLVALQDRLIGNRLGDVGFPGARFADEQRVLAGGNERQGVELEAGLARQFGIEGPVELGERELFVEPGLPVSSLDKAGLTTVQFVLQDQGEGLEEGLVGALRLQHARLQRVADARQAQLSQATFNFRHGHHVVWSPV
ncbi:Uncharacterised protein [Mycobacterium tuberculosis]|nr:Uncharacterised protein [Mycobacterium tuberculosis]